MTLTTPSTDANPDWRRHVTIATHNGSFHADEAFAVAVLQMVFPASTVVRTRDPEAIARADFAVDVGGRWEPHSGRFDHHQKDFAGARADGTAYASAGLVWKHFGALALTPWAQYLNDANISRIVRALDEELVVHVDRADTGASMGAPGLFGLAALVSQYNPTWLEENCLEHGEREQLKSDRFGQAVAAVKNLLALSINQKVAEAASENVIRASQLREDGRVLVLGNAAMPWSRVVCAEMPQVLFVVYPDSSDQQYQLRTVPLEPDSFKSRLDLPASWAGLRGEELARVTGVADAVFCHNNLFIAGAASLDGALTLAALALAHGRGAS